jgi:hypothetical protein
MSERLVTLRPDSAEVACQYPFEEERRSRAADFWQELPRRLQPFFSTASLDLI